MGSANTRSRSAERAERPRVGPGRGLSIPPNPGGAVEAATERGGRGAGETRVHLFQELGCARLPARLEPCRVVAVVVFASDALHVAYG